MAETQKNLLVHTYSPWAGSIDINGVLNKLETHKTNDAAIQHLKKKEESLYRQFGETTFEGFRNKLREVFDEKDMEVMRRFEPDRLENEIAVLARDIPYDQAVHFTFDFTKMQKETYKLRDGFSNRDDFYFDINYNAAELKTELNKIFKDRKFLPKSFSMERADALVHNWLAMKDNPLKIQIGHFEGTGADRKFIYEKDYEPPIIPNFPWGVTWQQYKDAETTESELIFKGIREAAQKIYEWLTDFGRDASTEMQNAIQQVWTAKFGPVSNLWTDNKKAFDAARFFSGGTKSNFIGGVQGALGEFQMALLFQYLTNKRATYLFPIIKGDVAQGGEQARTDVEIFEGMGLQVKNVSVITDKDGNSSFLRDLKTTIHPKKLADEYLAGVNNDFMGFLANFFFNKTYADKYEYEFEELTDALGNWLGEVMNMAVRDKVEDVVTFYVFAGQYLVPCSQILELADKLALQQSVQITSSYKGLDDKEYHKTQDGVALYQTFWARDDKNQWQHTAQNEKTYKNLVSRSISIRTNFNFFEEMKNYALWE